MTVTPPEALALFDENGCFIGHTQRDCGGHRTVGAHRAWCFDCAEWCSPLVPCVRCERTLEEPAP